MARLFQYTILICLNLFFTEARGDIPSGGPSGWPGISHHWAPAMKQAIGTAFEPTGSFSPVWFTVSEGILTEVFYPNNQNAQVGYLEFIVTDGESYFSEQRSGRNHENGTLSEASRTSNVKFEDEGMTVHIEGEDKLHFYHFDQAIFTDTASPVLRIHTEFKWTSLEGNRSGMRVFILFKPTANHSAFENLGYANQEGLFVTSTSAPVSMALISSTPWIATSAGYLGFSDPWQDLFQHFRLTQPWHEVGAGNIALAGEIQVKPGSDFTFDLALGFGNTRTEAASYASLSLNSPYPDAREHYEKGWRSYLADLQNSSKVGRSQMMTESAFARRSAVIIKMHEDKKNRGAIVASLSKPNLITPEHQSISGYHLIWPRDLYYAATGLLAAGDIHTPIEVLHFFRKTQKRDGSWAHSYWTDGTPLTNEIQTHDAAYPVLLASQLEKQGIYTLTNEDQEMIRKATTWMLSRGRTNDLGALAVEIAALRSASHLIHGPESEKNQIEEVANEWQSSIEKWTLIQNGSNGSNYYAHIIPEISNNSSRVPPVETFDEGFLALVKLGIRDAKDPRIMNTLKIYEDPKLGITVSTQEIRNGLIFRKNNLPLYNDPIPGGSYYPVLTAERGLYSIATHQTNQAEAALFALEKESTHTGLLPEQLSTSPSSDLQVRLGVACPLVWAHAEDILLHRSIEEGIVFDAPAFK